VRMSYVLIKELTCLLTAGRQAGYASRYDCLGFLLYVITEPVAPVVTILVETFALFEGFRIF